MDTLAIIKRIEIRLSEIGMSKADFYKQSGISSASFSQWKTGIYKPTEKKLQSAANCLGVSLEFLRDGVALDDDIRTLEKAKIELSEFVSSQPDISSGLRLEFLFNSSGYDHVIVCFNLGIDQNYLDSWMDANELPPKPIIDKILGVFCLKPEDLLSSNELADYNSEAQEWSAKEKVPADSGKHSVSDDDIKFALFGGDGEITDAMYQEVKEFAALIKLREDMKKSKE